MLLNKLYNSNVFFFYFFHSHMAKDNCYKKGSSQYSFVFVKNHWILKATENLITLHSQCMLVWVPTVMKFA